jgi:hypothetical protein
MIILVIKFFTIDKQLNALTIPFDSKELKTAMDLLAMAKLHKINKDIQFKFSDIMCKFLYNLSTSI